MSWRNADVSVPVLASALLVGQLTNAQPPGEALVHRTREYPASLVSCHDGDTCTFELHLGFGLRSTKRVRLCDVYAPELNRQGGVEARDAAESLLGSGPIKLRVALKSRCSDSNLCEQSAQGRVMAYWIAGDVDVGATLVKRKLARWYRKGEDRCGRTR